MLTLLNEGDSSFDLDIKGVTLSIANFIRRAILSDIYTFSIGDILIHENTTNMLDELLAHRLSMIPLVQLAQFDDDDILGMNDSDRYITIDFRDQAYDFDLEARHLNMPEGFGVVDDFTKIVTIGFEQTVSLRCEIVEGCGKDHQRFQCVSHMTFKQLTDDSFLLHCVKIGNVSGEEIVRQLLILIEDHLIGNLKQEKMNK